MCFANKTVREAAKSNGVTLWRLADELKISEPTMTRKLRRELTAEEQERLLRIIEEIAAQRKEG